MYSGLWFKVPFQQRKHEAHCLYLRGSKSTCLISSFNFCSARAWNESTHVKGKSSLLSYFSQKLTSRTHPEVYCPVIPNQVKQMTEINHHKNKDQPDAKTHFIIKLKKKIPPLILKASWPCQNAKFVYFVFTIDVSHNIFIIVQNFRVKSFRRLKSISYLQRPIKSENDSDISHIK